MTLLTINKPNRSGISRNKLFQTFPGVFDEFFNDFIKNDSAAYVPAVNIAENANDFTVDLSAPGFSKEDFKVEVEDSVLTVSGEHKTESKNENSNYTRKEFSYNSFKRSFTLPENVDEENINGKYENGILKLTLAKKAEAVVKATKEIKIA